VYQCTKYMMVLVCFHFEEIFFLGKCATLECSLWT